MVTENAVATVADTSAALAEQVVIKGDLSKLTEAQVLEIRRWWHDVAPHGLSVIAKHFNVSKQTVHGIVTGRGAGRYLRLVVVRAVCPGIVQNGHAVVGPGAAIHREQHRHALRLLEVTDTHGM